jgi:dTDP-4-amino-4,6-dideoxygalactose transaminase
MHIEFLKPDIREEDIRLAVKSIKSGWLAYGPYTKQFETAFAAYFGLPHAVLVSSGTAALHEAMILAGVGPGDEVIVPAMTWVTCSDVAIYEGATPVFADVDRDTGLIDTQDVERKITSKTKAIMVVHIYGQMADMKAFSALGKNHGIAVIEDACHAIEASRDGVQPGELSLAACFSFHAAKNIAAGQGGALVLKTQEQDTRARSLRRNGVMGRDQNRRKNELGYKYDGTDFQSALLIGQLKRIKTTHKKRLAVYDRYQKGFAGVPGVRILKKVPKSVHACHMFPIFVDAAKREAVRDFLRDKGVQTSIHYEAVHLEPYYREKFGFREGMCPVAENMGASEITLPTYTQLTAKEQAYIITCVKEAVKSV